LYNDLGIEDAVRHLAEIGWRDIEFGLVHVAFALEDGGEKRLRAVQRLCQELGVTAWQMHAPDFERGEAIQDPKTLANARQWVDYTAFLGVKNLVMHPGGSREDVSLRAKEETIRRNADAFGALGEHAAKTGVCIAIENLFHHSIQTVSDILEIIGKADRPSLGICIDTSHLNIVGLDIAESFQEAGERLRATHISDNDGSGDQHRIPYNAPRWSGKSIDWLQIMPSLSRIGYRGLLNLELLGEGYRMVQKEGKWVPHGYPPLAIRDMKLDYARKVMEWLLAEAHPLSGRSERISASHAVPE
jgi:sugar phosphate isomerase/epimerase